MNTPSGNNRASHSGTHSGAHSTTPSNTHTPSTKPECSVLKSRWNTGGDNSKVDCQCTMGTKQERTQAGGNEWMCKN